VLREELADPAALQVTASSSLGPMIIENEDLLRQEVLTKYQQEEHGNSSRSQLHRLNLHCRPWIQSKDLLHSSSPDESVHEIVGRINQYPYITTASQDGNRERITTKSEMKRGRGGPIIMRDMTMMPSKEDSVFKQRDRRDLSSSRGTIELKGRRGWNVQTESADEVQARIVLITKNTRAAERHLLLVLVLLEQLPWLSKPSGTQVRTVEVIVVIGTIDEGTTTKSLLRPRTDPFLETSLLPHLALHLAVEMSRLVALRKLQSLILLGVIQENASRRKIGERMI